MKRRKWAIIAGAITAGVVLLIGLGYGVHRIAAQEPTPTPVPPPPYVDDGEPRGPRYDAARWGWQLRGQIEIIAETLGLSVQDLVAALREGKSVADVAAERGVALEDVVEALLAPRREALDQAVTAGQMTQEEADARLAEMEAQITEALQQSGLPMGMDLTAGLMRRAQRVGWQVRGQAEIVAETLGLSVEDLVAALREGKSVADVAVEQGVALEEVVEALLAPRRAALDQAVAEGRLTQEEADARLAEMEAQITEALQQSGPLLARGLTGQVWRAQRVGWQVRGQAEIVAETLGLSVEDLVAALREGKSVADVAVEQGVALEEVVEALLAPCRERLEQAVAEGQMTQEEADAMLLEMEEQITQWLQEPVRLLYRVPAMPPCHGQGRRTDGSAEPYQSGQ